MQHIAELCDPISDVMEDRMVDWKQDQQVELDTFGLKNSSSRGGVIRIERGGLNVPTRCAAVLIVR